MQDLGGSRLKVNQATGRPPYRCRNVAGARWGRGGVEGRTLPLLSLCAKRLLTCWHWGDRSVRGAEAAAPVQVAATSPSPAWAQRLSRSSLGGGSSDPAHASLAQWTPQAPGACPSQLGGSLALCRPLLEILRRHAVVACGKITIYLEPSADLS